MAEIAIGIINGLGFVTDAMVERQPVGDALAADQEVWHTPVMPQRGFQPVIGFFALPGPAAPAQRATLCALLREGD